MVILKCPFCGNSETKVLDSRNTDSGSAIRRRRECLSCQERFTTYERREEIPIAITKKGGTREPFDRTKILNGLLRATVKRKVSLQKLEELVSDIEYDLRDQSRYEIPSSEIGEMILDRLIKIDKVAYVRFASVYKEFKDLQEFTQELSKLKKKR